MKLLYEPVAVKHLCRKARLSHLLPEAVFGDKPLEQIREGEVRVLSRNTRTFKNLRLYCERRFGDNLFFQETDMRKNNLRIVLSLLLCVVLITATALFAWGCGNNDTKADTTVAVTTAEETTEASAKSLGEGATQFTFTVKDADGKTTDFDIHTDKTTVGEALTELELIAGDQSEYGLYVKTVNGITVDYDKDGKYWAFYVNGEYASTGVDQTNVEAGATYMFAVE